MAETGTTSNVDAHSFGPIATVTLLTTLAVLALGGCGSSASESSSNRLHQTEPTIKDEPAEAIGPGEVFDPTSPGLALVYGDTELAGSNVVVVSASAPSADMTVLFLHGAAFTSETWIENGILLAVASSDINALAIDLPGFGSSARTDLANDQFLSELILELDLDPKRTVIVSPSMSGGLSLPALRNPVLQDLAGYVPVAPVGVEAFLTNGPAVATPALVIWGDQDGSDPRRAATNLASGFSTASVLILPDAGHAAYQHQPDLFSEALINFVRSLSHN